MIRTEDELRGFYADQPVDPAAEQRLRAVVRGKYVDRPHSGSGGRRWLAVVAAAAAAVATVWLSATHPRGPDLTAASTPSASTSPDASATVPISAKAAVGILVDLLPSGGEISLRRGTAGPGVITAGLNYHDAVARSTLEVTLCVPTATPAPACALPSDAVTASLTRPDGSTLVVSHPRSTAKSGIDPPMWRVSLLRPDGLMVAVTEVAVTADGTRLPVSLDELTRIVTSGRWQSRVPAAAQTKPVPVPTRVGGGTPSPTG